MFGEYSAQNHLSIPMHCADQSERKSGGIQEISLALESFAAMRKGG